MTTYTTPLDSFDTYTSDAGLGTEVQTDRDRPPTGSFVFGPAYDGTCFIIKDNLLYYCKPKQPEAWPALFFIEIGAPQTPGVTGIFHGGQPHYFTKNSIYYIQGTGQSTFQPIPLKAKTGAQSIRGAVSVDGKGVFHTGPDGIYLYSSGNDQKITEETLEPIFRGETKNDMPGVGNMTTSWLRAFRNNLYFGYASDGDYPDNVICMNIGSGKVSHFDYDLRLRAVEVDITNQRLLVGDGSGFVRVIENPALTDDAGTAITWQVQSKDFTLQTRKHFPRWVKYDIDASNATVTGRLILDDAIHHSHTVTGNRVTKRRLVDTGNGNKSAIRIDGSGPATIYSSEFE
jgi:hypothetical protein